MGFDGEDVASVIVTAINDYDATQTLLRKVSTTLEVCQKSNVLDVKVKQKIDEALQGIRQQEHGRKN